MPEGSLAAPASIPAASRQAARSAGSSLQARSRAPSSGRLYLSVNDDYLEDNSGEFRVMVGIQ